MPRRTPPWDSIPWYMTAFQSSPVRIWGRQKSQDENADTRHALWKSHECKIKLLYRQRGYEHRLIEGLSVNPLGDRRYTDKSFSLIKTTDNNLSCSIKSKFSHLLWMHEQDRLLKRAGGWRGGLTWNTVRMAAGKVSKLVVGVSSSKLNLEESIWKIPLYKERKKMLLTLNCKEDIV